MKKTMATILQTRMDKCTSEQFWAVATLTAMNGFLLSKEQQLTSSLSPYLIASAVALATIYGVWFIIQRHRNYYIYRLELSTLLAGEKDVPIFLQGPPRSMSNTLSGVTFYVVWVLCLSVVNFYLLLVNAI